MQDQRWVSRAPGMPRRRSSGRSRILALCLSSVASSLCLSPLETYVSRQRNNAATFSLSFCDKCSVVQGTELARPTNQTSRHTLKIMIARHRGTYTVVNVVFAISCCLAEAVLTIVGHTNMTFESSDVHSIIATNGAPTVHNATTTKLDKLAIFQPAICPVRVWMKSAAEHLVSPMHTSRGI